MLLARRGLAGNTLSGSRFLVVVALFRLIIRIVVAFPEGFPNISAGLLEDLLEYCDFRFDFSVIQLAGRGVQSLGGVFPGGLGFAFGE